MGRTLPSVTQIFYQEEQAINRFRRALRRSDQQVLDELLTYPRQHLAAATYATHLLPMELFFLAMLLEEHKTVIQLRQRLEQLERYLDE
jgi:hypothetical protein